MASHPGFETVSLIFLARKTSHIDIVLLYFLFVYCVFIHADLSHFEERMSLVFWRILLSIPQMGQDDRCFLIHIQKSTYFTIAIRRVVSCGFRI